MEKVKTMKTKLASKLDSKALNTVQRGNKPVTMWHVPALCKVIDGVYYVLHTFIKLRLWIRQ